MKKLTMPILALLLLSACGNNSPEDQLMQAEEHKKELESMLQTEEVKFQRNTLKLEALEDSISQHQHDGSDESVNAYVRIVEDYSAVLKEELDHLSTLVVAAKENNDLSQINDEIDTIIDNVNDAISAYDESTGNIELNESLDRKHNELQIANSELPEALESIKNSAEAGSMEALDEGLEMLNNVSEYY